MILKKPRLKPQPVWPDLSEEASLGFFASTVIIGVDEVGRGCLAGPVVAAAAVLDPFSVLDILFNAQGARLSAGENASKNNHAVNFALAELFKVRDSKLIPESERAPLAHGVKEFVRGFAVGEASVAEIEKLNILYASHLAMERAVADLEKKIQATADLILIDGHIVPRAFAGRGKAIIKGDRKSFTIACASIIAKVHRDEMAESWEKIHPGYGFKKHKGYPTPFHKSQIVKQGITSLHRKTFKGVKVDLESERGNEK